MSWTGWYRDSRGAEPISIENDGKMLSVRIRGVDFTGTDFDGLEPLTGDLPTDAPFTLSMGDLCACTLEWVIPVRVDLGGNAVDGLLECQLKLGAPDSRGGIDAEDLTMILRFGERSYATTKPHGLFEDALADLHQQLLPGQYVRSCVACAWSDYNPAGSPLFGGLACFRGNKDGYRQVKNKRDFFEVWRTKTESVQETHVCGEFERRGPGAGYRGSFPPERGSGGVG
jgi:hypothetical protein